MAEAWRQLAPDFPADNIHVEPSIEDTVRHIRQLKLAGASETQKQLDGIEPMEAQPVVDVLVTGSLLLVGGMIEVAGLSEVAL